MDYRSMSPMQLDALREVFNIGSGNSATSLSVLLNKKIDMVVPNIKIIRLEELLDGDLTNEVIAVLVKVIGEAPGNILYAFDELVAKEITKALISNEDVFSEIGMSVISEIGNIIAGAYMNSIVSFTGVKMIASVPAVAHDLLYTILTTTYIEAGQYDEYILNIETLFKGENGEDVIGNFYYIPEPGSLEKILEKLGMV
ncbi:MAG: chemotaxis protein CheC [Clostridium sp.]|nr:chemotaxis protein CheC [Clostridium sp.]